MIGSAATLSRDESRKRYLIRERFADFTPSIISGLGVDSLRSTGTWLSDPFAEPTGEAQLLTGLFPPDIVYAIQEGPISPSSTTVKGISFTFGMGPEIATQTTTVRDLNPELALTDRIGKTLNELLIIAKDEWFQDGMDSNLGLGVTTLLTKYPNETLTALAKAIEINKPGDIILAELLHVIGHADQAKTVHTRLFLLIDYLSHESPLIRDAAAVALAYLDDKQAIPYLHRAIERETNKALRQDLQGVVDQLAG